MDIELDNSFGFSLRDDPVSSGTDPVWQEFSSAAGHQGPDVAEAAQVAQLLNRRANATLGPGDLIRRLNEVGETAQGSENQNAARLSTLLIKINPEMLSAAVAAETNITQRKRFLHRATASATPTAILFLARATAAAYDRPMSRVLGALMLKLSREAEELPEAIRILAEHSFRELFDDIVEAWSATSIDMGSTGYDTLFQQQKDAEPVSRAGSVAPEPERVIELAFETGALGNVVWTALAAVGEKPDGVRRILDMVKQAPHGSRAAKAVAQQFANPVRLSVLLREDPVDFEIVDTLLEAMGENATATLLEAVGDAKSRATRRGLLDRLVAIGPSVGPMVTERLNSDVRWYVQRNMLTVLREAKCSLAQVPLEKYTAHADARVRREATQLLFQDPLQRDRALAAALRDTDVDMLKIGLKAARESMPESCVPILAKRVVDPTFPPEFRTSGLQLLGRSTSILALESLLRFVAGGTSLLGKPKLAPKTPEMLIALSALARSWPNERRAAALLFVARDSKDKAIAQSAVARAVDVVPVKEAFDDE